MSYRSMATALLAVLITLAMTGFSPSSPDAARASTTPEAARAVSPLTDARAAALRRQLEQQAAQAAELRQRYEDLLARLEEQQARQAEEQRRISDLVPPEYRQLVIDTALRYGLEPRVLAAVGWVESRWNPQAQGAAGETGVMQIMPETAAWIAKQMGLEHYDLTDPATSVAMGAWYLRTLLDEHGSLDAALAAYNGGPAWRTRAPQAAQSYVNRVRLVQQNP